MHIDRARGALWGQAVGDALGTTQEFERPRNRKRFPALNLGPQTDLVGKGPFGLTPGQVTDDTQMAAALAGSLADHEGFDAAHVAQAYVAWSKKAFDIGRQTAVALKFVEQGLAPHDAGLRTWDIGARRKCGNGSLMRCVPLPVYFHDDPLELRAAALDDAAITHFDPRCRLAGAVFSASVRWALTHDRPAATGMAEAARDEIPVAAAELARRGDGTPVEAIHAAADALREDLRLAAEDDPVLDEAPTNIISKSMGFVRIAFRLAFWELLHVDSFEHALLDVANRGGDADTNCAITGVLLGALHGENAIPSGWRRKVESQSRAGDPFAAMRLFRVLPES